MKIHIIILVVVLLVWGTGISRADEIVLENGKIYSGNVLHLTDNTVSIQVDNQEVVISRKEVHAVFLGDQTPFSTHGYPGLQAKIPEAQQNLSQNDSSKN